MSQRKTIYVLATGGTIAMQQTAKGYTLAHGFLEHSLKKIPELQNLDMPHYELHELEQLMDSANMTPEDWLTIAAHIQKNYDQYDGFVILHGTDTMAYTASALSFMLENLNKPVILTGSQLPLFETRSDARENFINALWMAGHYAVPEVCIYFNNKLFRGNRSKKIDSNSFAAFASPNFPALAEVGAEIQFRQDLIRPQSTDNLRLQHIQPMVVGTLRVFPGITLELMKHILQSPLQALILETYGLGTAPETPHFLEIIQQVTAQGILVINCSQCWHAKVKSSDYTTSTTLLSAGVIPGGDMTTEAVIAKLFYLFSSTSRPAGRRIEEIKLLMTTNLRGELTN